jgi:ATP-binding cassette, subfamily B, bacterial
VRRALRGIRAILALALEADARLAFIASFSALLFLGGLLGIAVSLKLVVDATIDRDAALGLLGGALAAISLTSGIAFIPIAGPVGVALQERVGGVVDRRLMELTAAVPSLELQDRPEYLSKLRLLLDERFAMNFVVETVSFSAVFTLLLVGLGVVLALQHPLLMLLPLVAIPTLWLGIVADHRFSRAQDATAEKRRLGLRLLGLSIEPGAGKESRIFGLSDELVARHSQVEMSWRRVLDKESWKSTRVRSLAWVVFSAAYLVAVLIVVQRAVEGEATAGDVILTIAAAAPLGFMAGFVAIFVGNLQRLVETAQRYEWLREMAEEAARPPADPASIPASLKSGIRLEAVSFTYPGSNKTVLSDVTLDLPAGSVVALVGENGAGKTTLVKLLSRLYDPSGGRITVDGIDLKRMPTPEWRKRISAGFQDFIQFEVLARETVGLGDLPRIAETPAVETALDRAGASDVTEALPQGLETQLGKEWKGSELSTGQWQKLALSRSFMRDKPLLLILDEPTAALDATAEHALFERFSRAAREGQEARDRITILVSHRFSTVRMADLIIVIDGGRVVENGSHSELVRLGGLYANLYEIQASAYR